MIYLLGMPRGIRPNALAPGHASQQDPIRSDNETIPEEHAKRGHALRH